MGLDMYLNRRHYISRDLRPKLSISFTDYEGLWGEDLKNINASKVKYIEEEACYWRKANQIHNWFVQNVQNGDDDCNSHDVSFEQIEELLTRCKSVFSNQTIDYAMEVLPVTTGFYFGSYEYDDYYWEEVEDTISMLTEVLKRRDGQLIYHSSW